MKKLAAILFVLTTTLSAQVEKDLDKDGVNDSIAFDTINSRIVCKLSTQQFKPIQSKTHSTVGHVSGVLPTKNGFEFYWGSSGVGFAAQFRYEPKSKRIRLIGMSSHESGPQHKDEEARSSVNLLTNEFIGEMSEYDEDKKQLVAIPAIKVKMVFPKIHLEDFGDEISDDFFERSNQEYNQRNAN